MSATTEREERFARAERVLAEFFQARAGDGAEAPGFETFLARFPELSAELRELHAVCAEVDEGLQRGQQALLAQQAQVEAALAELRSSADFARRYEVERELGKGGMGAVFRVLDKTLGRPLAMKVILGQFEARAGRTPPVAPRQLERFLNEAKLTGQLDHPGIVPVHEVGIDAEGRAYFTMKLVQGRTLGEIFRLQATGDSEWTRPRVLSLIQRVCEAMAYAHERGVIHRDLKPANVMVGDFGEVYVMDWGLARRVDEKEEPAASGAPSEPDPLEAELRTRAGAIMGTPAYMPPEQASADFRRMGPHSDVYAIGAMLYQLIAGHAPYCEPGKDASSTAVLLRIVKGPPQKLVGKGTPPELIAICQRAMARETGARYQDVRELSADLGAFLEGRVVRAYEVGAWAEARKWIRRNRALSAASAAGIAAVVVGLVTVLVLKSRADRNAVWAKENEAKAMRSDAMSAEQELEDRIAAAERLWPARPENIEPYRIWLRGAEKFASALPDHRKSLAALRLRAIPWTETERAEQGVHHPRLGELEAVRRHLVFLRERKAGLETSLAETDPRPEDVGLDLASLPTDASDLCSLARPLVDPERKEWGWEGMGLILARRALELSSDDQRASSREILAWGLFAAGRFDESVSEGERALEEAAPESRAVFESSLKKLQAAIDGELAPEGLEQLGQEIAGLEAEVRTLEEEVSVRPDSAWAFDSSEDRWWHDRFSKLVEGLAAFSDPVTGLLSEGVSAEHGWGMRKRLEFAGTVEARSVSGPEAAASWKEALASIADVSACPRYEGLRMRPQVGLLPIGRDPDSGLWEFAELQSGEPAQRGVDGKLVLGEGTGLVLVLLPGGTFRMGAQPRDPARPNYDPEADLDESPVQWVKLAPFLISKYEMTQGQWLRFTGKNPSDNQPTTRRSATLLHPVEQVSWLECERVLRYMALSLPTEAQWEYAARAGTTTVWWTGDDVQSLKGAANLADEFARTHGGPPSWQYEKDLNDGHTDHAPVGSFRANSFGLHDVLGNVWEWCLDEYLEVRARMRPGDGRLESVGTSARVLRGGSFNYPAVTARCAVRRSILPDAFDFTLGLRPARSLEP